jgi:23S rRNA (guanine745-N1)-methyltransferase
VQASILLSNTGKVAPVPTTQVTSVLSFLDIGCGEGYYTSAMQQVVEQCVGVDIAKNAVQRAAKLNTEVTKATTACCKG